MGSLQITCHLLCRPDIVARYYAFADQDDIWDADKSERALDWLHKTISDDQPALYCSRVRLVDEKGSHLGVSPLFARFRLSPISFGSEYRWGQYDGLQ